MTKPNRTISLSLSDLAELRWYFSYGITAIERSTMGALLDSVQSKVLGNGCSVQLAHEPNEADVLRAGAISSTLAKLAVVDALVLLLAHGDAGFVATDGGRLPEQRWRCVAHLTVTAIAQGRKNIRPLDFGDPARLWLERNWARGAKVTREINRVEKEARALLDRAELNYAAESAPRRQVFQQRKHQNTVAYEDRVLEGVR